MSDLPTTLQAFDAAFLNADYDALDRMTADDYMMVNPLAQVLRKVAWLEWLKRDIVYSAIERREVEIRRDGDSAIVTSRVRAAMAVVGLFGGAVTDHLTFRSEFWRYAESGWRLHHVHLTRDESQ
jgi:ketosteroid isomerase-like protein